MEIITVLAITAIFSWVTIKTIEGLKIHNELHEAESEATFKQAFDSLHARPKVYSWKILGKECEQLTDEQQNVEQHLKEAVERAAQKETND